MSRLTTLTIAAALALGGFGCGADDGARGAPGEPGERGPAGEDGADGADGEDGADGTNGTNGADGADGEDGADGANGADGADGADGAQGPVGPPGPRGPSGTDGRTDWTDYVMEGGQGRSIVTRGGNGTSGDGGNGDYIEAYNYTARSTLSVLSSGTPNTAFTAPAYSPYLGENPKTISANTTLALQASAMPNSVVAGSLTILGDDGATTATGLHVAAGVTLTIVANIDTDNADADANNATGTLELAQLDFDEAVFIEGTVVVSNVDGAAQGDAAGANTANVDLDCAQFISTAGSAIDLAGDDEAAGTDGGDAGDLDIYADESNSGIILVGASVNATGGDGDNGGTGGDVYLSGGYGTLYILGGIDSSGGAGNDGIGGSGGELFLNSDSDYSGGNYIAGNVLAAGGDGTGGGGDGGSIYIDTEYNGAVVVTPTSTIDASGGDATGNGAGGDGNDLDFYAYGGTMRIAGTLVTAGGDGAGAGNGGGGGSLYFQTDASDYPYNNSSGGYGMYIGANMDASGGDGANGGSAGSVSMYAYGQANNGYAEFGVEPLLLLGYDTFDASGGDGTVNGGDGGDTCYLETYEDGSDNNGDTFAPSTIVNEADWDASGGNGGTGNGGDGGGIEFDTDYNYHLPSPPDLINSGALTSNGGNGNDGGDGGYIFLYALRALSNTGDLSNAGGTGVASGGSGGSLDLAGDYSFVNEADIDSSGGNGGTGDGGQGGSIWMASRLMSHTGNLMTQGGDSVDGAGGNADGIEVIGTEHPSELSGTVYAGGGVSTNGTDGEAADVFLDAVHVALDANGEIAL